MTFRQLNDDVNRAAHAFRAMGLEACQRIALLCKNHRAFVTAFFGAAKCGIITIPINWRLHPQEIQYILEDSGASVLIYDSVFADKVRDLKQTSGVNRYIPVGAGEDAEPTFDALISQYSNEEPELKTSGDDCILIMYTSGTTGKPKGAMITHTNLLFASIGITHVIDWWNGDRFLSVAPFFHIGGFVPLITNIQTGATSILMADFDPVRVWKTVEQERITTMMTVPAMLAAMHHVFEQAAADVSSLRNITCGASAVPKTLIEAFA
jgi:acyl-CoA synthetase (AMP-forming)/AMP-acid ligase II